MKSHVTLPSKYLRGLESILYLLRFQYIYINIITEVTNFFLIIVCVKSNLSNGSLTCRIFLMYTPNRTPYTKFYFDIKVYQLWRI